MCKILVISLALIAFVVLAAPLSIRVYAQDGPDVSCANVDGQGDVEIGDALYLLNWLFFGGQALACEEGRANCGNVNSDSAIDVSDVVYLLNWLFRGGAAPVCKAEPPALEGFTSLGENEQGYPEYMHDQTGIVFVLLPGGTFWMGSQDEDPEGRNYDSSAAPSESPVREVTLSPFLMAKFETTQRQWLDVMGENPSCHQPDGECANRLPAEFREEERWLELPVEHVSWDDIQAFEERSGLTLPSEAQWEYACRAGTSTRFFPGGDSFGCSDAENCIPVSCSELDELGRFMWMCFNSEHRTHEVGTKLPNQFGLHDTHGNVREWCEDVGNRDFYSTEEATGSDPVCTSGSENRVGRGGRLLANGRSAARHYSIPPSSRREYLGFRPSKSLP